MAAAIWASHDRIARTLIRKWRGREVGRSDGFLVVFGSSDDALRFSWDYHDALRKLEQPLGARVGVHWGKVAVRKNTAEETAAGATPYEVDGLAVPAAARIMSFARAGQTLFSSEALTALGEESARMTEVTAWGFWRVKGLDEPFEISELSRPGGAVGPPEETTKAYRVTLRDSLWVPVRELPHNLGIEPDLFIGREEPLGSLALRLQSARLVTVLGAGGIGKTRLAQRYARGWLGDYAGGAWFCDLSVARTLDGLALAVAHGLGTPLGAGDPIQQLTSVLVSRGHCLVVLDNFEQVVSFARATLGVWLQAAPQAKFLATSREALRLPGEQILILEPLLEAEAETLFHKRMLASGLSDELEPSDSKAIPELVKLLDRLPLAIELAAARVRVVAPADQVRRIGERFRLLASRGGRPDRQATMRATLEWSWDLLGPEERAVLAQLSVFEGGFTLAAAEAVVEATSWLLDVLQSLVEKSLVRRLHARRFDLLRTVQDFAAEQLGDGRLATLKRHAEFFSTLPESDVIADGCIEIDNLASACRSAAATGLDDETDTRHAVGALANAWVALRQIGPIRAAVDLAGPLASQPRLAPRNAAIVQRVLGAAYGLMGKTDDARASYSRATQLAVEVGDKELQAELKSLLADLEVLSGRLDVATILLEEAHALGAQSARTRIVMLNTQGQLAIATSAPEEALKCFSTALELARLSGDLRWQGGLHGNLGRLALTRGDSQLARSHLQSSIDVAQALGNKQWLGNAHCNLGFLLYELGELEAAKQELCASLDLARALGHMRLEATALCNLGLVLRASKQPLAALTHFQEAAQVAHTCEAPVMEGQFRGYLGQLLGEVGRMSDALAEFERAERVLTASGDPHDRLLLLCQRVVAASASGETDLARSDLQRAEHFAAGLTLAPGSELASAMSAARQAVR